MTEEIVLRLATLADAACVHGLVERGYRGESARLGWTHQADLVDRERIGAAELLATFNDPAATMLVAADTGGVIGCVQVVDQGGGSCALELLCVEPRRQRGGLGSLLVSRAEREARDRYGAVRMAMTVIERRTELVAFYGRRGYRASGERRAFPIARVALPLLVLAKQLDA